MAGGEDSDSSRRTPRSQRAAAVSKKKKTEESDYSGGSSSEDDSSSGGSSDEGPYDDRSREDHPDQDSNGSKRKSTSIDLDYEPLTEEQLEAMAAEKSKKKPYHYMREKVEDAKGETTVQFIPTRRGGLSLLFRSYFFRISRKQGKRSYYRCQTKGCKTTMVLENDLFKSIGGEHLHEPDEEKKMMKMEKRRLREERAKNARANRLEKLRQKEEERRLKAEELVQQRLTNAANPSKKPELTVEEILALQQTHTFNHEQFDDFDARILKLFNSLKNTQSNIGDTNVTDLLTDWEIQKQRIKTLSAKKERRKDKRFNLLKAKLDTMTGEREMALSAKQQLEAKISSVNIAGCQLLLNELQEIKNQFNLTMQQTNGDSHHVVITDQGSNGQTIATIINGELLQADPSIEIVGNAGGQGDYKVLYEQTLKERDSLAIKLHNYATPSSSGSSRVHLPQLTATASIVAPAALPLSHFSTASEANHSNTCTLASTYTSLQPVNVSNSSMAATTQQQHHYAHMTSAAVSDQHTREPQILLFEGSHAANLWRTN